MQKLLSDMEIRPGLVTALLVFQINVNEGTVTPDRGEESGSVLGGGVERVVLVALVWRVAGKEQRSRL